jgi:hypothetical protein
VVRLTVDRSSTYRLQRRKIVEHRSPKTFDATDRECAEPPISEAELTALAMKDPPPDDFRGSEAKQERPNPKRSEARIVWLVGFLIVALVGALFAKFPKVQSHEIARQRSPDGIGDAILMEFALGTTGLRRYKVRMQRPSGSRVAPSNCREVAYLGGVSANNAPQPVTLIWNTSSELEIRYVNARSVHVYQPVFTWGPGSTGIAGAV